MKWCLKSGGGVATALSPICAAFYLASPFDINMYRDCLCFSLTWKIESAYYDGLDCSIYSEHSKEKVMTDWLIGLVIFDTLIMIALYYCCRLTLLALNLHLGGLTEAHTVYCKTLAFAIVLTISHVWWVLRWKAVIEQLKKLSHYRIEMLSSSILPLRTV